MQNLYTLITISDEESKEEITIPSGRYCINSTINHDDDLINLNLTGAESLPEKNRSRAI